MNFAKEILAPQKILVSWQKAEHDADGAYIPRRGRRFIIGQILHRPDHAIFEYLHNSKDYEEALEVGFKGYTAFKMQERVHTNNVREIFARRLPDKSRPDYADFLKYYRIAVEANLDNLSVLAYTGGELPSDGFSFLPSYEEGQVTKEFVLTLAAARYYVGNVDGIKVGSKVSFRSEPENEYDPYAVATFVDEKQIGYIKKGQSIDFSRWLNQYSIESHVERVNGTKTEPNILIFGTIKSS